MSNPWLKKNPFMSMWLSAANSMTSAARAQMAASAKRQSKAAMAQATHDAIDFWTGALTPKPKARSTPKSKAKTRPKARAKRKTSP